MGANIYGFVRSSGLELPSHDLDNPSKNDVVARNKVLASYTRTHETADSPILVVSMFSCYVRASSCWKEMGLIAR